MDQASGVRASCHPHPTTLPLTVPQRPSMTHPVKTSLLLLLTAMPLLAVDFPEPAALPANPAFPDPLVMRDGTKITSAADWTARRKPELRALFEHYMYG